ncbi:MAG: methyltransferase domain-containing protein [Nitrospirae bacterium]|nr:methyltransferase domain-containing protein [Nitrospirota bacterium]
MRWDAERYDRVKAPQIEAGKELTVMAGIREDYSVLDIGCGTGKLTLELSRLASGGEIVGIDPSEEMQRKAEEVSAQAGNIRFIKIAAESMDFIEQFDLAFSNSALQWVKDQPQAIARTHRALKPGGRIAFQLPARNFCREFFAYTEKAIAALKFERFYENMELPWYLPSKEEYERLLLEAGFAAVNVSYRDYAISFDSIGEIMDWWSSAGLRPYLAVLPDKEQGYFSYAVGMQYEQNWTGKKYEFNFRRLFAFAEKEK